MLTDSSTLVYVRVTPLCAARILADIGRGVVAWGASMSPAQLHLQVGGMVELFCTDLAGHPTTVSPGKDPHQHGVAIAFRWSGVEAPIANPKGADLSSRLMPGILYHEYLPPLYGELPRYRRSLLGPDGAEHALTLAGIWVDPVACAKHWLYGAFKGAPMNVPQRRRWPSWCRRRVASRYGLEWAKRLEHKTAALLQHHDSDVAVTASGRHG